jgi:hypothetical protein
MKFLIFIFFTMKPNPTNAEVAKQAMRANQAAIANEEKRRSMSTSFDSIELDQAQLIDRIDQENWSWEENGSEKHQECKYTNLMFLWCVSNR